MNAHRRFGRWEADGSPPRRSANAEVFKVRDADGQALGPHALKLLHRVERRERFAQEANALQKIASLPDAPPQIIKIVDSQLEAEESYIVTPWIAGGDADKALIRTAKFVGHLGAAVSAMAPIVGAINYLHKQALAPMGYIAHRDLKPANLLVGDDGGLIITDFGCALFDTRLTESDERVGSVAYAAPELLSGPFEGDHRPADVYSLGCILWAFLSGKDPPVKGDLRDRTLNLSVRFQGYEFQAVHGLILACVSTRPERRPDAATLLRELSAHSDVAPRKPGSSSTSLATRLRTVAADPTVLEERNAKERRQGSHSRLRGLLESQVRRKLLSDARLTGLTSDAVYTVNAGETEILAPESFRQEGFRLLLKSFASARRPDLAIPQRAALAGGACRLLIRPADSAMVNRLPSVFAYVAIFEIEDEPAHCIVAELVTGVGVLAADRPPVRLVVRAGEEGLHRRLEEVREKLVREVESSLQWGLDLEKDGYDLPIADPVPLPDPPVVRPLTPATSGRAPADRGSQFVRTGTLLGIASNGTVAVESNDDLTLFRFGGTEERTIVTEHARSLRLQPCGVLCGTLSSSLVIPGGFQRNYGRVFELDAESATWSAPYYSGTRGVLAACYSPDGTTFAVVHQTPGAQSVSELLVVDRATGSTRLVRTLPATSIIRPAWWQARNSIVAWLKTAASDSLVAVSLANGAITLLAEGSYDFVSVSPAGDRLAVLGPESRSQHRSVCIIDLNGAGPVRTTFDAYSGPSWTSDGEAVLWTERNPNGLGLEVRGAKV